MSQTNEVRKALEALPLIMRQPPPRRIWERFKKRIHATSLTTCWLWTGKHQKGRMALYASFLYYLLDNHNSIDNFRVIQCWGSGSMAMPILGNWSWITVCADEKCASIHCICFLVRIARIHYRMMCDRL